MSPLQSSRAQALRAAMQHLQAGRPHEAEALLSAFLTTDDPEVLNLAAVAARQSGRLDEAVARWRRSLSKQPTQPQIWVSLAHALRAKGAWPDALSAYERALTSAPQAPDALLGAGLACESLGQLGQAAAYLERAVAASPRNGAAHEALGALLTRAGRPEEGLASLDNAARLTPSSPTLPHNRGVALEALSRDEACVAAFTEAVKRLPRQPASWFGLGNARRRLGDMAGAIDAYRAAIDLAPTFVDAHHALNETVWQAGQGGYLASFPTALHRAPQDPVLRRSYAHQLNRVRQYEDAEDQARQALRYAPDDAGALDVLAQALLGQNRLEEAVAHFKRAVAAAPNDVRVSGRLAEAQLRQGATADAHDVLSRALQQAPLDQENLARMTIALRLLGEERAYAALADYETFTRAIEVRPPDGYRDMAAFHAELTPYLQAKHLTKQHPTDQTLRGGTQTLGALFDDPHPLIVRLRERLQEAVTGFVAALPDDARHPFLSRKRPGVRFSGSWSVRLQRGGFHTNHIHPEGWISSAYYIGLPPDVAASPDKQGWFKLGETNADTCPPLSVERWVKPAEGSLVLFPSYFWHGTQPFAEGAERLTVAFDVLPTG